MTRVSTPLVVSDLSSFARHLAQALSAHQTAKLEPPGHVELQNLLARAAGYRNLQALKATPRPPAVPQALAPLSDNARRTLMQFDTEGRLVRWPTKFTIQRMAMWVLWTRFEGKRVYTEREVNAILEAVNGFGDHVTLRRELVNHQLLTRKSDCSEYRKLPARPDAEVRALLTAWRAGAGTRARPSARG
ncbi:MAG TPA: DUF2087 domain-containing protein [Burkholderiaceae bacterium]|nr:DUF2087 domain-containing protein [Burkholderiaceae bacterium]